MRESGECMRILHCIASLGGGGAERQLSYLAPQLARSGAQIHVAYLEGGPNLRPLQESGVHLHRLEARHTFDWRIFMSLWRLVRQIQPHVIQTWLLHMDVLGGGVAMLTGTPHVLSERCSEPAYEHGWRRVLRESVGRRAAAIVANSSVGLDYWNRVAARPLKRVISNALPFEQLDAIAAAAARDASPPIVISAGRFAPEKNTLTLVKGMALVAQTRTDVRFRVFGEGPELAAVRALRDELGMRERIEILSYSTRLWEEMSRANVFVSASLFEGAPNTVLEAAAIGCPLVLSNNPSHRELFDAQAAFFIEDNRAEHIAAAIGTAIDDAAAARGRADRARAAIAGRSIAAVCAEYQQIYRLLLPHIANAGEPGPNSC